MTTREFTVTGVIRLSSALPVVEIGRALMDCAAEIDENTAVSINLAQSTVEIECVVGGDGLLDGLANGKILIHEICSYAELPVQFVDDRRPCANEWRIVDESATQPNLVTV